MRGCLLGGERDSGEDKIMENGKVIKEHSDGTVSVGLARSEACAKCGACSPAGERMIIRAQNPDGACINDTVSLSVPQRHFFAAVGLLYAAPAMCFFAGAALGYYGAAFIGWNIKEPVGFGLGCALAGAAYLLIHSQEKRIKKSVPLPVARLDSLTENSIF